MLKKKTALSAQARLEAAPKIDGNPSVEATESEPLNLLP